LCCLVLNCKAWQRWDLNPRPSALLPVASALHHSDGPHRHSSKEMESFGTTLRRKPFAENWELMRRREDTHAPESYYSGRGRRTRVLGGSPGERLPVFAPGEFLARTFFYLYFSKCLYIKKWPRDYIIVRGKWQPPNPIWVAESHFELGIDRRPTSSTIH